eukprot:TRINITY_DN548_c0_g1_i1.p1 TRINITY_DN548_c0_g1~~TRINITY_DN548_c0_g1_i1.p1  ORF type:complete len:382 (+),score=131.85 TRINITY_DN548_c0_g1_i1:64-1209(+)
MKITIRTVARKTYEYQFELDTLIGDIKNTIEQDHGHEVSHQTLIFSGKFMEDDKTIGHYNITEKDFVVLMIRKPRAAPAPEPEPEPEPEPQPTPVQAPTPTTDPENDSMEVEDPNIDPDSIPADDFQAAASSFLSGQELENAIVNLVGMGFPRENVEAAMTLSYNNSERAIDFLTSPGFSAAAAMAMAGGAPAAFGPAGNAPSPGQEPSGNPEVPAPAVGGDGNPVLPANFLPPHLAGSSGGSSGGSGVFDFLRNHPDFDRMRMLIQRQPELLNEILQAMSRANPQLITLVNQHQEEFVNLLNEPIQGGGQGAPVGMPPGMQGMQGMAAPGRVTVTEEEMETINNLVMMGFDRRRVEEAFILFDKDAEMTANYLLNNPEDL